MYRGRPAARHADARMQEDDRAEHEPGARELCRSEPLAERERRERDTGGRLDSHEQ